MSARSSRSVSLKGKRLAFMNLAKLRALFAAMLAGSCLFVSACSDDSNAPDTTASNAQQDSAANASNAPSLGAAQPNPLDQAAQPALPARTIQSPPPSSTQLGAAASDSSLAPPVIHTVD